MMINLFVAFVCVGEVGVTICLVGCPTINGHTGSLVHAVACKYSDVKSTLMF